MYNRVFKLSGQFIDHLLPFNTTNLNQIPIVQKINKDPIQLKGMFPLIIAIMLHVTSVAWPSGIVGYLKMNVLIMTSESDHALQQCGI